MLLEELCEETQKEIKNAMKTNKTILIVGPAGPQGKSTLCRDIYKYYPYVVEISDLFMHNYLTVNKDRYNKTLNNGICHGFYVINFTDKPKFKFNEIQDYNTKHEIKKWHYPEGYQKHGMHKSKDGLCPKCGQEGELDDYTLNNCGWDARWCNHCGFTYEIERESK